MSELPTSETVSSLICRHRPSNPSILELNPIFLFRIIIQNTPFPDGAHFRVTRSLKEEYEKVHSQILRDVWSRYPSDFHAKFSQMVSELAPFGIIQTPLVITVAEKKCHDAGWDMEYSLNPFVVSFCGKCKHSTFCRAKSGAIGIFSIAFAVEYVCIKCGTIPTGDTAFSTTFGSIRKCRSCNWFNNFRSKLYCSNCNKYMKIQS